MDLRLEAIYKNDSFLQQKIQELTQLKSEFLMISNRGLGFDHFGASSEKDEEVGESSKQESILKKISKENLDQLLKVFIKYSGSKDYFNVKRMESLVFHRFLEEAGLYSSSITKVSVDLMLYKNKAAKILDFWKFVEILIKIGRNFFSAEKKYDSLISLLTQKIVPALNITKDQEVYMRYHAAFIENNVQLLLRSRKPTLRIIFNLYKSTDSADIESVPAALRSKRKGTKIERIHRITLKGFLSFLTAFEFLPSLISGLIAAKLFRNVPCQIMFNECLDYKEFTEVCLFTALHIYEQDIYRSFCTSPFQCFELWFKFLDAHPKALIENANPLRNSVYTLQQHIDFS